MFIREGTPSGFSTMSSGTSVWKEWHIFYRKYTGNNTLVTMTSGHLITNGNLSLLCDVDTYGLVNTR